MSYVEKPLDSIRSEFKEELGFLIVTANNIEKSTLHGKLKSPPGYKGVIQVYDSANTYYIGLLGSYLVMHLPISEKGSVSKDGAMLSVGEAIAKWPIKAILLAGICFGIDKELTGINDILVCRQLFLYEYARVSASSVQHRGPRPEPDSILLNRFTQETTWKHGGIEARVEKANLLSGDKLVDNEEFKKSLVSQFPECHGGEMEGAGLYACAQRQSIPWLILKSICDWGEGKNDNHHKSAAQTVFSYIEHVFRKKTAFTDLNIHPVGFDDTEAPSTVRGEEYLNQLVSMAYRNRKPGLRMGFADWENGRISYQYASVEVAVGVNVGLLFIPKTARIQPSLDHFLSKRPDEISSLSIITPMYSEDQTRKEKAEKFLQDSTDFKTIPFEVSYMRQFAWKFGIECNPHEEPDFSVEANFVDQNLYKEDKEHSYGQSLNYFRNRLLDNEQSKPVLAILGAGGAGKSTVCLKLAATVEKWADRRVIYLASSDLQGYEPNRTVDSVSSLYYAHAAAVDHDPDEVIDESSFEINVGCGNIIVIIDGIDEISTALGSNFNLESLVESAVQLNEKYNNCSIIMSSRDYHAQKFIGVEGIETTYLLGFNKPNIESYFSKRLPENKHDEARRMLAKFCGDGRDNYVPLYLVLICNLLMDYEQDGTDGSIESVLDGDENSLISTPLDSLVTSVLRREVRKHSLRIDVDEYLAILFDIAIEYGGAISILRLNELIDLRYGEKNSFSSNGTPYEKIQICPLIRPDAAALKFEFRYQYLNTWAKSKFLAKSIIGSDVSARVIDVFKELYDGKSQVLHEASGMIKDREAVTSYCKCVFEALTEQKANQDQFTTREIKQKISGVLYLLLLHAQPSTMRENTEQLKAMCNSDELNGIYIFGSFFAMDFSEIEVWSSEFFGYQLLTKSKFPDDKIVFFDTKFTNYTDPLPAEINSNIFDSSCELTLSMRESLSKNDRARGQNIEQYEQDLIRVLKIGFSGGRFYWKSSNLFKKVNKGLQCMKVKEYLEVLTIHEILIRKKNKSGAGYGFIVNSKYHKDVSDYITQGITSRKIKEIIRICYDENS